MPKDQNDDGLNRGNVAISSLARLGDLVFQKLLDGWMGCGMEEPARGEHDCKKECGLPILDERQCVYYMTDDIA